MDIYLRPRGRLRAGSLRFSTSWIYILYHQRRDFWSTSHLWSRPGHAASCTCLIYDGTFNEPRISVPSLVRHMRISLLCRGFSSAWWKKMYTIDQLPIAFISPKFCFFCVYTT